MLDLSDRARLMSMLTSETVGLTPWVRTWDACVCDECHAAIVGWRVAQTGAESGIEYACRRGHRFVDYWEPGDRVK